MITTTSLAGLDPERWTGRIWTGEWRPGSGGDHPVVAPATGEQIGRIGFATAADVDAAAEVAAAAQREWAARTYEERAEVLRRAGDLWQAHSAEIGRWVRAETGSFAPKAGNEVAIAAQECYEAAALAAMPYGEMLRTAQPRVSLSRRLPVGVVAVIAPFNAPIVLSIRAVAPALALGNAVLLKPDSRTPVSGGVTLAAVFEAAGLPQGLLQVLPGRGTEVGERLVTNPRTRVIAFTGSTGVGRRIGVLAAQHLKRAHLELGGNNALIVLDDADLTRAPAVGAVGNFTHQGQICVSVGRQLVHESIADEYVARLAELANSMVVGDTAGERPVHLGPIIDAKQRDAIHAVVTDSIAAGAQLKAGGTFDRLFYRPTVLDQVTPQMPAFRQEIFGPVASITRFRTLDEAVELARDSEYGLSLGILTADVARGMALADRIPTGMVHINDHTINDEAPAPFGGVAASGTGSRHGGHLANLEAFTETQWMTVRADLPVFPL